MTSESKTEKDRSICHCGEKVELYPTKWDTFSLCPSCFISNIAYSEHSDCCNNPSISFVNMPRVDGVPLKRTFCSNCGYYKQVKMSHPTEWKTLPLISATSADAIKDVRNEKVRSFFAWAKSRKDESFKNKNEAFWRDYNIYLNSNAWKDIRKKIISRDKGICQACLESSAEHVHHLTYANVFNENMFELISVCVPCHSKLHDRDLNYNFNYDGQ